MTIESSHLHVYQCKRCQTVAVTAYRHPYGDPLFCNMCHAYMSFRYRILIETDEHRDFARRGVVYNPGFEAERLERQAQRKDQT